MANEKEKPERPNPNDNPKRQTEIEPDWNKPEMEPPSKNVPKEFEQ